MGNRTGSTMTYAASVICSAALATALTTPLTTALTTPLAAQSPPAVPAPTRDQARTTTLSGVITNLNGFPVPRAEVFIAGIDMKATTNADGIYEFFSAPIGRIKIVARRLGYEPTEERVTLEEGRHKQVDFELKAIPELLDSVMVREAGGNGRMSDFWARRMTGVGAFITRADIERRRPQQPSDLLRTVTGVKVTMGESGFDRATISMGRNTVLSRSGRTAGPTLAADCKVSYYVDGSSVPGGTFHMDDMSSLLLEAIEVYRGPAETPAKLRQRDSACGVIMIWTREPPSKQALKAPGRE